MTFIGPDSFQSGRQFSAARRTLVKYEINRRVRRNFYLPLSLISDPAWDILLHLYSNELVMRHLIVTELLNLLDVPNTTATRWLNALQEEGLIERAMVAGDPAKVIVGLTVKGLEAMQDYFS